MTAPTLGWSDFARERYRPGDPGSRFAGTESELLDLVRAAWDARRPGSGRSDLERVVVVPVPPDRFRCDTVLVDEDTPLTAQLTLRAPGEDPYVEVRASGPCEPALHAAVVLYSAATLLENGGARTTDADWEVVALIASPVADEPMDPLTMARNQLEKTGGTPCRYTSEQYAEAVWYWSRRARSQEG